MTNTKQPVNVNNISISVTSQLLFMALVKDAGNWNGQPLLDISKEERGNVTQLKRAGLITTEKDEGNVWVQFTEAGKAFAVKLGATLSESGILYISNKAVK